MVCAVHLLAILLPQHRAIRLESELRNRQGIVRKSRRLDGAGQRLVQCCHLSVGFWPGVDGQEIRRQMGPLYLPDHRRHQFAGVSAHREQVPVFCAHDGLWYCLGQYYGHPLLAGGGQHPQRTLWGVYGHYQHDDCDPHDFANAQFWHDLQIISRQQPRDGHLGCRGIVAAGRSGGLENTG